MTVNAFLGVLVYPSCFNIGGFSLPPVRCHSANTYLSSLGMLGTKKDYFPKQQPLL